MFKPNNYEFKSPKSIFFFLFQFFSLKLTPSWINPLNPKFISWKQPFPGMEHVAHFPTWPCVHSTEVRLHRASVNGWPPLLIPLMIFMSLTGAWQGVSEVEICPIFLTILPRSEERNIILKCDTWSTSNLGFFWWGRLPTIHQGRFRPSTSLKKPAQRSGSFSWHYAGIIGMCKTLSLCAWSCYIV